MEQAQQKNILIVDDDSFLLDMYALKFSQSGFSVSTSLDPVAALEKIRKGQVVDVLLIDIMMPVMNGFEVLEKIQTEKLIPTAIKVVLTNEGLPNDIEQAQKLGAAGYIVKSNATPAEVIEKVNELMGKK
jgi:CheY-like chemotaxis protein